jgi:3-hydroxyisobutyrate dehydrogenase-like beta-hydroxyacid dehydrogenase
MSTTSRIPSVGFVGLGVMGEPMASHLSRAGHPLALYDAAPGLAARIAAGLDRASALATPADVAAASDIVITMVPNGEVVRDLIVGANGLLEGLRAGSLLLDTSSSEPWLTRGSGALLADKNVAMVDAPVSGAQWGAQAAELVFMVGGDAKDVERVRPLLDAMGRAVFHLGPLGCGHAMKCLNNLVTSVNLLAVSEGLAIGKRYGLDPSVMTDVLNESTGMSWVSQTHIKKRVISRAFDDPFKLALMLKDIGIATELSRSAQIPTPIAALTQQLWRAAALANEPDASVSELVRWVEKTTRTELTSDAS